MKLPTPFIAVSIVTSLSAAEVPEVFAALLEPGVLKRGEIGMFVPPKEIEKYVAKVESAARKDPEWFRKFSSQSKPGVPLPFDERLGLTKEEYAEYLALWAKREFMRMGEVCLLLRESLGSWVMSATGKAEAISTLRYDAKDDLFRSPNGDLKHIQDVKALHIPPQTLSIEKDLVGQEMTRSEVTYPETILGDWSGSEWKFEEETSLGKIKETIALGRYSDNKFGLVVYHLEEFSTEETRVLDRSLVIRFPLGKAVPAAESKPAPVKVKPKTKMP